MATTRATTTPPVKASLLAASVGILLILSRLLWVAALTPAQPPSTPSSLTLRVCSGCLGRCRGSFNPLTTFEHLVAANEEKKGAHKRIDVEESFCMNQCKKGPIVRLINAENTNVLTLDDTLMTATESSRKAFQRVLSEERVQYLWKMAHGVLDGDIVAMEQGPVDKLHDLMPKRKQEKKTNAEKKNKVEPSSTTKSHDKHPKEKKKKKKKKKEKKEKK